MIPNDLHTIVVKLVDQHRNLPPISVPRRLCQPCTPVQLHVFTDASISAFAAVIYARPSHTAPKLATITFVLGKSRVAPLKQLSVLKLELEAALLGIRLLQVVRRALDRNFLFLSSGQTVVLCSTGYKTGKNSKVSLLTGLTKFPALLPPRLEVCSIQSKSSRSRHKRSETNRHHQEMDKKSKIFDRKRSTLANEAKQLVGRQRLRIREC